MQESDIVTLAIEKAREWHKGQTYGQDRDYFTDHVYKVAMLVQEKVKDFPVGFQELCLTVALLHDVLEDCENVSSAHIKELFGVPVVLAVECLSDGKGKNRRERKLKSYHRIRSNDVTVLVKVADRLVNMRNCISDGNHDLLKMYLREHDSFYAALWSPYQYFQDWWDELEKIYQDNR